MIDLTLIDELRQAGHHAEAKEKLIELVGQHPTDPAVQYAAACVHDFLGLESAAVPFYLAAIENGLSGNDLRGAFLGLGSTYRTLGRYTESKQTFLDGLERFPDAAELRVFLAMTQYNLAEFHNAMASLLNVIADTSTHAEIQGYERAIRFYAADLDRRWE